MVEITESLIRAHALENAVRYNGKANEKAVLAALFAEGLEKSQIKNCIKDIVEVVKQVNDLSLQDQKKDLESLGQSLSKREVREGLPDLVNVDPKKGVVMRFAPFPSGPLHIGNSRTLILNDEYVKKYGGKLLLVMDDTLGSDAKPIEPEAYDLIEEGVKWLGVKYDSKVLYKSERIQMYYKYADELFKKGYFYVCDCPAEERRENKANGISCGCRQFNTEKQLIRWKDMFNASEGSMCARLKTSMGDPDPAFRDPIMFRISDRPHAKLKNKYRVYPLLHFSWAIDDHAFGVTHILRGMELAMETRVEKFIWDIFEWSHPEVIYNGHFELEGVKISKSKGAAEVKNGTYDGWNDPRLWSLQSLRDRGISPESIRQFVVEMGLKKTNITSPVDVLYAINKKNLEDTRKYFFVENPQKISIGGCPELNLEIPYHPNRKGGKRMFHTKGSFFISEKDYSELDSKIYRLTHLLNFSSDNVIKTKPKDFSFIGTEPTNNQKIKFLSWLPADAENSNVEILREDGSLMQGFGEESLRRIKEGTMVNFEKIGFARLHKKTPEKMEFWFAHN